MANAVFKQEFWRKEINNELDRLGGLKDHSDLSYTGEVKGGNTLHITGSVRPTVGDYTPGNDISFETVAGTGMDLVINQKKYATQLFDDVDKAQSIPGVMENAVREMAKELHYEADKYVASVLKSAVESGVAYTDKNGDAATATIAAEASASQVSKDNALTRIDAGLVKLYENDVAPTTEVYGEFSPAYYGFIRAAVTPLLTNNIELAKKGIVGKYNNVNVCISNALPKNGSTRYNFLRTGRAVAFAGQVDSLESGRAEKQFADYVKALYVFGSRVVRPKEIYAIKETVQGSI